MIEALLLADPTENIRASALDALVEPRHRWYFFKEAFSPSLVVHALQSERLNPKSIICDPFSGGGTTVVEASRAGYLSYGHEVNPFLVAVAKAKLAKCSSRDVRQIASYAIDGAVRGRRSRLEAFSTFSETSTSKKWLFNIPVLRAFYGAWHSLESRRSVSANVVRIALIGAAMDCANARKDGKCLRYKSDWQTANYDRNSFLESFAHRVFAIAADLDDAPLIAQASVNSADSRRRVMSKYFDLCVTSPPYLNSFDYTDVYRPELFLGGFVTDMMELSAIRHRTIRSHVQVKWTDPKNSDFGAAYQNAAESLLERTPELWNRRIPLMVQAYFEDIQKVLSRLRLRANAGASAWFVVSTSAYAGIEIPVDIILSEVAERSGWTTRSVQKLRNLDRVSVQQWDALAIGKERPHLRESIVILDA